MTKKELEANTSLSSFEVDIRLHHDWSENFSKRHNDDERELHRISEIQVLKKTTIYKVVTGIRFLVYFLLRFDVAIII